MRLDAVPDLKDHKPSWIVLALKQLAGQATARRCNAGDYLSKKGSQCIGLTVLRPEIIDACDAHQIILWSALLSKLLRDAKRHLECASLLALWFGGACCPLGMPEARFAL